MSGDLDVAFDVADPRGPALQIHIHISSDAGYLDASGRRGRMQHAGNIGYRDIAMTGRGDQVHLLGQVHFEVDVGHPVERVTVLGRISYPPVISFTVTWMFWVWLRACSSVLAEAVLLATTRRLLVSLAYTVTFPDGRDVDLRAGFDRADRYFVGLRIFLGEHGIAEIPTEVIVKFLAGRDSGDGQGEKQNQRQFTAGNNGWLGLSRLLRREVIEELGNSPDDQDQRPVAADGVSDMHFGKVLVEQQQNADQDEQQAAENRSPFSGVIGHWVGRLRERRQ